MFFKGTPRRGVGAIARETKSAGGYLNASTTYDHTSYFAVLPASGLEAALDIQSDALRNSVDRRRRARPRAPGHHPGSQAEARHAVRRDLRDAARSDVRPPPDPALAHRPRGPTGRLHPRRSLRLLPLALRAGADDRVHRRRSRAGPRPSRCARAAYGDWPAAPGAVDPSPAEPERREVRARTLRGDVTQAELVARLAGGAAAATPTLPHSILAAAVLGRRPGQLALPRAARDRLVTWVAAHNYAPTELGVFSVAAELASRPRRRRARRRSRPRRSPGSRCSGRGRRPGPGPHAAAGPLGPAARVHGRSGVARSPAAEALDGYDLARRGVRARWPRHRRRRTRDVPRATSQPDAVSAVPISRTRRATTSPRTRSAGRSR